MTSTRFRNEKPLQVQWGEWDLTNLTLTDFPLVEDFSIIPVWGQIPGWTIPLPHLVGANFRSDQMGNLGGFQWWETIFYLNKIRRTFTLDDIPWGTLEDPHYDGQVGWDVSIFKHLNQVCILQSTGAEPIICDTWFRVSSQSYSKAWFDVMAELHQI